MLLTKICTEAKSLSLPVLAAVVGWIAVDPAAGNGNDNTLADVAAPLSRRLLAFGDPRQAPRSSYFRQAEQSRHQACASPFSPSRVVQQVCASLFCLLGCGTRGGGGAVGSRAGGSSAYGPPAGNWSNDDSNQ